MHQTQTANLSSRGSEKCLARNQDSRKSRGIKSLYSGISAQGRDAPDGSRLRRMKEGNVVEEEKRGSGG